MHVLMLSKAGQELLLGAIDTTPLTVAGSLDRSLVADALFFLWTVWTSKTPADSAHAHYEVSEKAGVGPSSDTLALKCNPTARIHFQIVLELTHMTATPGDLLNVAAMTP